MAYFAVRMVHGPAWDPARGIREQRDWDAHASFMDGLVETGLVILGGPVGDGGGALLLIQARDDHEIRARMSEDPWADSQLLHIGAIEPWQLWLDGRGLTAPSDRDARPASGLR